jgi:ribosomal protein L36
MKKKSSLKKAKTRHKDNIVIRRGKKVLVVNAKNKRCKVSQG